MPKSSTSTSVDTTKTTTSTSSKQSGVRAKQGQGSQRQQQRAELVARIRAAYWALTPAARSGFRKLCRQMPENLMITKTGTKLKISSFFLFSMLNQAAHYSGAAQSVLVPPDAPGNALPLPKGLKLVSAYDAQGVWSLKLTGGNYGAAIALALAAPALEGVTYRASDYLQAGPLPSGVTTAGVDLTDLFLAIFPAAPGVGEQVGAQIMGVTLQGFSTPKLSLPPAVTTAPGAEQSSTDEDADTGALHAA